MTINTRPLKFIDYLPEVFRPADGNSNFLTQFLNAFELVFEGLQQEIEGQPDLSAGGIPDLFSPATTPPAQFAFRPQPGAGDVAFLNYLASWIALPLRPDKPLDWNREFFKTAIGFYAQRSTLPGMEAMLQAWLKGDLLETAPARPLVSDLTPASNAATAVFQLGATATLGVDTVLGSAPPFLFVVDLAVDSKQGSMRAPAGIDAVQRAARAMLDLEKPAHTYYRLAIRTSTMQLAPQGQTAIDDSPAAQIGVTTLIWQEPWSFISA
jgi:phage tail-like protein